MRHTYATYLYQYTKNLKFVSKMLGHTKTSNTDKYVHIAECIERQLGGNLFHMALKPHDFGYVGEQPKKQLKMGYSQNRAQLKVFSPVSRYGLSRVTGCSKGGLLWVAPRFWGKLKGIKIKGY